MNPTQLAISLCLVTTVPVGRSASCCDNDSDCQFRQRCNELSQCFSPIGTCDEPVEITETGTYSVGVSTLQIIMTPIVHRAQMRERLGNCGEAVIAWYAAPGPSASRPKGRPIRFGGTQCDVRHL